MTCAASSSSFEADRPDPSSLVGSLARREPEDLAILSKYLHGVVEPRSKEQGASGRSFLTAAVRRSLTCHDREL
jgi:hypothetical protein